MAEPKQESQVEELQVEFTNEELQKMVRAKTVEITELNKQMAELQNDLAKTKARAMKVYEENAIIKASPELAVMKATMDYHLHMAGMFIESGAFPNMKPAQAYTLIKAGAEMGLKEIESMRSLYIVKGAIKPYGNFMLARFRENGYSVEYIGETKDGVTVRVYNNETGEDYRESAEASDPTIAQGKALGFARFNKLRYHATRRIVDFHLPHLFSSITDTFSENFLEPETPKVKSLAAGDKRKQKGRLEKFIANATDPSQITTNRSAIVDAGLEEDAELKLKSLTVENTNENEE